MVGKWVPIVLFIRRLVRKHIPLVSLYKSLYTTVLDIEPEGGIV